MKAGLTGVIIGVPIVVVLTPPGVGICCNTAKLVLAQMVKKNERRRHGFACGYCGSCAIFCVSDSGGGDCDHVGRVYDAQVLPR